MKTPKQNQEKEKKEGGKWPNIAQSCRGKHFSLVAYTLR